MTRTILYQILIVVALVLGIEAALRIAHTIRLDLEKEPSWFRYAADVGWDRRPGYSGDDDCDANRTFDENGLVASEGERLAVKDGPKRLRVVFLGDSNTYGACRETDETYVSVAGRLGPQVDVINLGMNGYTSFQGYKALLKYGPSIRADLIFISFNMNDRRFVLGPELADSDAAFRRIARGDLFQRLSEASYFVWAAAEASTWLSGRSVGIARTMDDTESTGVRLDKVVPRVSLRAYRDNLNNMVRWARQNNSAVAFLLLGDNPSQTKSIRDGLKRLAEKDHQGAVTTLEKAKDDEEDFWFAALARLYLSKIYVETGRSQQAKDVLSMQDAFFSLVGGYPIALDTDYHAVMRDVASEHGIPVVDAASELNKHPDVFWDYCHFDEKGHEIVGRMVAEAIKAHLQKVDPTR